MASVDGTRSLKEEACENAVPDPASAATDGVALQQQGANGGETAGDAPSTSAAGGAEQPTPLPEEGRKVTTSDIQLVQNLIERCLQLYMSQKEVVSALHTQARVEPGFTQLVWQKLEEQNPDFFRSYYTRLKLKDQIVLFNHLLEQQVQMVQKLQRSWMQPPGGFAVVPPARPGGPPMMPGVSGGAPAMSASMPPQQYPPGFVFPGWTAPGDGTAAGFVPGDPSLAGMGPDDGTGGAFPGGVPGMTYDAGALGFGDGAGSELVGQLPPVSPDLSFPLLSTSGSGCAGFNFAVPDGGGGGELALPRNFSLSDLNFDLQHADLMSGDEQQLPRNFSLSELAPLDVELDQKPVV